MKELSIEELMAFLHKVMPSPKDITEVRVVGDAVTFVWKRTSFLVTKKLAVFEIKNNKVFITATSLLVGSILAGGNHKEHLIEAVIEMLRQAEELLSASNFNRHGIELLDAAKRAVAKMLPGRKPPSRRGFI